MTVSNWREKAECGSFPADLFFGPDNEGEAAREMRERSALSICATCPVTEPCREWADATGDHWSVSGGTTPRERSGDRRRAARERWAETNLAKIAEAGEKRCSKCGETKPLTEFTREKYGWRSNCRARDCRKPRRQEERAA